MADILTTIQQKTPLGFNRLLPVTTPDQAGSIAKVIGAEGKLAVFETNGHLRPFDVQTDGTALPAATEQTAGIARLATQIEALAGSDDTTIMTPLKTRMLAEDLVAALKTLITNGQLQIGGGGGINLSGGIGQVIIDTSSTFSGTHYKDWKYTFPAGGTWAAVLISTGGVNFWDSANNPNYINKDGGWFVPGGATIYCYTTVSSAYTEFRVFAIRVA